jgi:hypothetical protein
MEAIMWSTEHSAQTSATPPAVWVTLRALHSGTRLSERSDHFALHGPFAVGTEVSVTPQGQATMTSVITECTENEVYADRTRFGGLELAFRHTLVALPGGGSRVTHRLEISGDESDALGPEVGPAIAADFPATMADLLAAAEQAEANAPAAAAAR